MVTSVQRTSSREVTSRMRRSITPKQVSTPRRHHPRRARGNGAQGGSVRRSSPSRTRHEATRIIQAPDRYQKSSGRTRSDGATSCIVVTAASNITARRTTMGRGQPGCSLRRLRAQFAAGTATGLTDGELLERYAARRAESAEAATAAEMAFAALVDRHGPMVWGVCRGGLGAAHEAEAAFQATFLVLVRKVRSVRVDGSLGRWLYGVAHRVALRARSEAERRRSGIDRVPTRSSDDPVGDVELKDLRDAVSE